MRASPRQEEALSSPHQDLFRVRTIAAFVMLRPADFDNVNNEEGIVTKIRHCHALLQDVRDRLERDGYEVQTVRVVTNPFGEWLFHADGTVDAARLTALDDALASHGIDFCALGPSHDPAHTRDCCPVIVASSHRFSCSAAVGAADVEAAHAAAACIMTIARFEHPDHCRGGLGNFRFCAAASCQAFIPFFPAAKCESAHLDHGELSQQKNIGFALGLENGKLAHHLLSKAKSLANISSVFRQGMVDVLTPLERICQDVATTTSTGCAYLGIDSSLNPSLDEGGSVARAFETLDELHGAPFGGTGTLAAAAAVTAALQSLDRDGKITLTGYCGLMLPVLEDDRLASLSTLTVAQLLSVSSVCGVGVDTVPLPGNCDPSLLGSLILDVAGLAGRWDKSLSCRVFPVPGLEAGEETTFDSPYLCNGRVFKL